MPPKLEPYEFFDKVLKSPRYVVAPMVDASELAWRMLGRKYGANLCYTPMWHSGVFIRDSKYRQEALQTCPQDRPLIVQFCANDPEIFRKAVELTVNAMECDAIDLNIGCPQVIAKRGHFGSFLQDEWELLTKLVRAIHDNFEVPITCKLRVFDDVERTVRYAQMLESAGAQILTVHGRTRDQKGALTGLADWEKIKAVKQAVKVPVIANGNIQFKADADRCMALTGVDGVMSAEGHLTNPALFANLNPPVWEMCEEYLDLAEKYPCPLSYSRGHLFKILHHVLQIKDNFDVRQILAKGSNLDQFREGVALIKERFLPYHTSEKTWVMPEELISYNLRLNPWLCQPYERPPPEEHLKKLKEIQEREKAAKAQEDPNQIKRVLLDKDGNEISRKKQKKMERNPYKKFPKAREQCVICQSCQNPAGTKCDHALCRKCCRQKCYDDELDCVGHRCQVKTRREAARRHKALKEMNADNASVE